MNSVTAVATGVRSQDASAPRSIARAAIGSLWAELALHPKPGLVSLRDAGAHADMDASTFVRSLFALSRYFSDIAAAGAAGATFPRLRALGMRAEADMLAATGGINTHRGAIFAVGLLCASAARADALDLARTDVALRRVLLAQWGIGLALARAASTARSNGAAAARRHGVGGARGEALAGFPAVFDVALPALRHARDRGCDVQHARLSALFALFANVADTNVLHRGGAQGLAYVRGCAHDFRAAGDVFAADAIARAQTIHRAFVARRLSPGGCADLLAAAIFVDRWQQTSP